MEKDSYVHPYPASHGCIRVKKKDIEFLAKSLKIGDTVKVYGKW
jgi:lipoprotein-anchoring transpeptidase ErfK/SrfK